MFLASDRTNTQKSSKRCCHVRTQGRTILNSRVRCTQEAIKIRSKKFVRSDLEQTKMLLNFSNITSFEWHIVKLIY